MPEGLSILALNRVVKELDKADLFRRSIIMRSAELKYGVVPSEDLIPNKGSAIQSEEKKESK